MRWDWPLGIILGVGILAGCGTASPEKAGQTAQNKVKPTGNQGKSMKKAAAPSAKPFVPTVAAGSKLFSKSCASCHGKGATGTGKGPRLASSSIITRYGTEVQLEKYIEHNMPANNPGSLTAQQAANAAAYVWSIAGGK